MCLCACASFYYLKVRNFRSKRTKQTFFWLISFLSCFLLFLFISIATCRLFLAASLSFAHMHTWIIVVFPWRWFAFFRRLISNEKYKKTTSVKSHLILWQRFCDITNPNTENVCVVVSLRDASFVRACVYLIQHNFQWHIQIDDGSVLNSK